MIVKSTAAAIGALGLVITAMTGPALAGPSFTSALATTGVTEGFVHIAQLEEPVRTVGNHRRFKTNSP